MTRPARRRAKIEPEYLTVTEAATFLGVSARTVWRWIDTWRSSGGRRGLPGYQMSPRQILIRRAELAKYVDSRRVDRLVEV